MSTEVQKKMWDVGTWVFRGLIAVLSWFAIETFNDMKQSVGNIEARFDKVGEDVGSIKVNLGRLEEKVDQSRKDIDRIDRKTEPK